MALVSRHEDGRDVWCRVTVAAGASAPSVTGVIVDLATQDEGPRKR